MHYYLFIKPNDGIDVLSLSEEGQILLIIGVIFFIAVAFYVISGLGKK